MADTQKTPSTVDYIETWAVCVVVGFLIVALIDRLFTGQSWGYTAVHAALLSVLLNTVVIILNARRRRSGSTR